MLPIDKCIISLYISGTVYIFLAFCLGYVFCIMIFNKVGPIKYNRFMDMGPALYLLQKGLSTQADVAYTCVCSCC